MEAVMNQERTGLEQQLNGDFVTKTATALGTSAGYLQSHDLQSMIRDVEEVARRNPMPALIGAAAFGVILGAYLKRI